MKTQQANVQSRTDVPDREALRADLEATRTAFHELLNSVSSEEWQSKGRSTAWTVRELFTHLAHDMEFVPRLVEHAREGKDMLNMPSFLTGKINYLITRWMGRKETPQSLAEKYDSYFADALATLDAVQDDEWQRGANFFGEGFWTIEQIFKNISHHFEEHSAQIRETLNHK